MVAVWRSGGHVDIDGHEYNNRMNAVVVSRATMSTTVEQARSHLPLEMMSPKLHSHKIQRSICMAAHSAGYVLRISIEQREDVASSN